MKKFILILICLIIFVGVLGILIYKNALKPVSKTSSENTLIEVEISEGMYLSEIAKLLEEKNVIKSSLVMTIYAKFNDVGVLKAGNYTLDNSEDMVSIINHIVNRDSLSEATKLTFIEGKNMRWVAKMIAEKTNNTEEDVFSLLENEEYIDSLIEKYWFITDEIKDDRIYYPLEGYLLPDTYNFENQNASVEEIFTILLNHMEKYLNTLKDEIDNSNLTVHQILTLASITELEGKSLEDRAEIIGVFFHRLKIGMSLGSDVTTYYAFKVDMGERDLTAKEINTENPYNTRGPNMIGKIPVGPIDNPSKTSIEATIIYTPTDNLYFVADKNGKVYFTPNYTEHQKMIKKLKNEGLWFTY